VDIVAGLKKHLTASNGAINKKQLLSILKDEHVTEWQVTWFRMAIENTDLMGFITQLTTGQVDTFTVNRMASDIKQMTNLDGEKIVGWLLEGFNAQNPFVDSSDQGIEQAIGLITAGDYKAAYAIVEPMAAKNHPRAVNFLGTMYNVGQYVEKNIEKAAELFRRAGDLGEARGYCNLADCIINNRPTEKMADDETEYEYQVPCTEQEQEEVRDLIQKAAAMLGSYGNAYLGWAFHYGGYFFEQNIPKAVTQYELAVSDNTSAMYNLGLILCFGEGGIKKDEQRGINLIKQAAENEDSEASEIVGLYTKAASIAGKTFSPADAAFGVFVGGTEDQQNDKIEKVAHSAVFGVDKSYSLPNIALWLFLTSLFQYLWFEAPENEQNLFMVKELIDAGVNEELDWQSDLDRLFKLLEDKAPNHIALKNYQRYKALARHNVPEIVDAAQGLFYYIGKLDHLFRQVPKTRTREASRNLSALICTAYSYKQNLNPRIIKAYIDELSTIISGIAENKGSAPFNIFELVKSVKEWICKTPIQDFNANVGAYLDFMILFSTEFHDDPKVFHKYIEAGMPISGLTSDQLKKCVENFKVAQGYAEVEPEINSSLQFSSSDTTPAMANANSKEDEWVDDTGNVDIVTVTDEDGNEHSFEELDRITLPSGTYVALAPLDKTDDDDELIILRAEEQGGDTYFSILEDEREFDTVGKAFAQRLGIPFSQESESTEQEPLSVSSAALASIKGTLYYYSNSDDFNKYNDVVNALQSRGLKIKSNPMLGALKKLLSSTAVVVFLSSGLAKLNWAVTEVEDAYNAGVKIVPVYLEDSLPREFRFLSKVPPVYYNGDQDQVAMRIIAAIAG